MCFRGCKDKKKLNELVLGDLPKLKKMNELLLKLVGKCRVSQFCQVAIVNLLESTEMSIGLARWPH